MILFILLGLTTVIVLMDFPAMIADRAHFAETRSRIFVKMAALASK